MDHNGELLESIYEGAEIGRDVLGRMIRWCEDANFRHFMAEQFAAYHKILMEAERLMLSMGKIPRPASRAARLPIFMGMRMNLRIDKTSSHMAEMLMQGTLMGAVDILRDMRRYKDAQEDTLSLARQLLETEDHHMQTLRQYL